MASFGVADLYNIAMDFFGEADTRAACSPGEFIADAKRQWIVINCIKVFCQGDLFFKVVGDKPMPSYGSPPGITDFLQFMANYVTPAQLQDRIKSNVLERAMVSLKFKKYWELPDSFVP